MNSVNCNMFNYSFKGNGVNKKNEEKEKESVKPEEKGAKPQREVPSSEPLTANAMEVMANQLKGELRLNKAQQAEEPQGPRSGENVQSLIDDWNANNKTMTKEEKMALLTQIIDMLEAQNDGYNAKMWRVRRYTTACNHTSENLQIWNNMLNGGEYSAPQWPLPGNYEGMNEDIEVWYDFNSRWNSGQCTDEEKIFFREYWITQTPCRILYYAIQCKNPSFTPEQLEQNKHTLLNELMCGISWINGMVWNNPQYTNEPWQQVYNNEFQPIFAKFKTAASNNETHADIAALAGDLQSVVAELRQQGFPYCDELLISIQGYIAYAGYFADPNVLPNNGNSGNENGGGNVPGDGGNNGPLQINKVKHPRP